MAAAGSQTQRHEPARNVLELSLGHPGPELLPPKLLAAMLGSLAAGDTSLLQYGAEPGAFDFRSALAQFLSAESEQPTAPEALFITAGASQALALFCSLYTRPGDTVLVEEPCYHLALILFADHGLRVESLPDEAAGPDALEATFRDVPAKLVYLVPSYANPSAQSLSPQRRQTLLELTASYGVWLVADEVYRLLNFDGAPPPTLAGAEHVIVLGSFSKILAPGLRLGWLEASPKVLARIEQSGLVCSGGGLNPLAAALTCSFVGDGSLSAHLAALRQIYAERCSALGGALQQFFPQASFAVPTGGYFLWLQVPGRDSAALLPRAREVGVSYQPGPLFSTRGAFSDFYRLCFAHYPAQQLKTAAQRLATALKKPSSI